MMGVRSVAFSPCGGSWDDRPSFSCGAEPTRRTGCARSLLTPSGTANAPWSAYGTRMYSAWLPAQPPKYQHFPQLMKEHTTTRSPTRCFVTADPVSTTSPRNSWPSTSPARIVGTYPPSRCRSEPHDVLSKTRTMMSCAFRIAGSSTFSTWSLFTPVQQRAFTAHPRPSPRPPPCPPRRPAGWSRGVRAGGAWRAAPRRSRTAAWRRAERHARPDQDRRHRSVP